MVSYHIALYHIIYIIYIISYRGVTIRRATIRYVSRYVVRDTTNDTISDDTPTNLESQTHTSVDNAHWLPQCQWNIPGKDMITSMV